MTVLAVAHVYGLQGHFRSHGVTLLSPFKLNRGYGAIAKAVSMLKGLDQARKILHM